MPHPSTFNHTLNMRFIWVGVSAKKMGFVQHFKPVPLMRGWLWFARVSGLPEWVREEGF